MSEEDRKALGARLKATREYLDLSQEEVANALGLRRSAISLIESGARKVEAIELKRFAELYQTSVADLAGEVRDTGSSESVRHLARAAAALTEADQAELLRFAEFLRAKGQR